MKPDPIENNIYTDDCMLDNFAENYQLCQLIRDESFGWPLQDLDLDADPFNGPSPGLDFDVSEFDSRDKEENSDWNQLWCPKSQSSEPIPESAWDQLSISPSCKLPSSESSTLTPSLSSLEFPKSPCLPDELALLRSSDDFQPSSEECFQSDSRTPEECHEYQHQWEYRQSGDLGRGTYVVHQPAGPGDIITIGIYTRAERAAKIHRFRQKRERRNFSRRILYGSRKRFADSRPRVGGRFVVNENRIVKPRMFLKRGRPRKGPMMPAINAFHHFENLLH